MQLVEDGTDWRRNRRGVGRLLEDQGARAISTISETGERVHKTHKARHSNVSSSNFEGHGLPGSEGHGRTRSASHTEAHARVAIGSSAIRQLAPMEAAQGGSELRELQGCQNVGEEAGGRWKSLDMGASCNSLDVRASCNTLDVRASCNSLDMRASTAHVTQETPGAKPGPDAPLIELLRYSLTHQTSPHHFHPKSL